jgi:hypothetical protein
VTRAASGPGAAVGEGPIKQLFGAGRLDLRALGLLEEGGALNLTGVLCRLLVVEDGQGKTWAQRMAEVWVVDALEGNPRAIEDILDRIEKGRLARASAAAAVLPSIDDGTASKILEVLCDRGEDATGD